MTRHPTAALALVASLLLAACTSGGADSSTSTTGGGTSTAVASSTTSTTAPPVLRTDGIGALMFGMNRTAAQATGLIGPEGPGCEPAGTTGAPLLPPLVGSVAFSSEGRVLGVELRSGATTAEGVAPDATVDEVIQAYDGHSGFAVERVDSTTEVFGVFLLNVSKTSGEGYVFLFDKGASKANSVTAPGPSFCE